MAEYIRKAEADDTSVERLEAYKEMLLTRMDSLMQNVERLALQVEQIDQAIAGEQANVPLTEEEQFVRGTE